MSPQLKPLFGDGKRINHSCPMTNGTQARAQDGSEAEIVSR